MERLETVLRYREMESWDGQRKDRDGYNGKTGCAKC